MSKPLPDMVRRILAEPDAQGRELAKRLGCSEVYVSRVRTAGGAVRVSETSPCRLTKRHAAKTPIRPGVCQRITMATYPDTCGAPTASTYCPECERKRLHGPYGSRFAGARTIRHTA